jgi:hypothetical protein
LLTQTLRPATVVGARSDETDAEDGLEGGDLVSVVRKPRKSFEHFRLGIRHVE